MKVKPSVSLSAEVLCQIDTAVGGAGNRSQFLEALALAWRHFRALKRAVVGRRDVAIYNRWADGPTFESDVSDYGIDPLELGDDVEVLLPTDLHATG